MLKTDYKRWNDLVETDHHDLNQDELTQFVCELKDAIGEILKEYESLWTYYSNVEYANTLLKASTKKLDVLIALRGKEPKEEDYPDEDDYAEAYGDYFTAFEIVIDSLITHVIEMVEYIYIIRGV